MKGRILAVGIDDLPATIKCISWEEISKGMQINISDYKIVFIDFSYFIKNKDSVHLIDSCLTEKKFFEIITSGVDLYIFGIFSGFLKTGGSDYLYSWLPEMFNITTTNEQGEIINCQDSTYLGYFNLLKKWSFYFNITFQILNSGSQPYLCDTGNIALNNANKIIGFKVSNFLRIDVPKYLSSLPSYRYQAVKEKYPGKLIVLHSLYHDTNGGVLSILEKKYHYISSKEKPNWVTDIHTKKSMIINKNLKKLLEDKQKIESEISTKKGELQKIEYYKHLFWQIKEELEQVVHNSLKLMGIMSSPPTKADDDGIIEYNKKEFVLEIKSHVERCATYTELTKLITRVENRKKITGKECKGIFIINHYANYPPDERDKAFPNNVEKTAKTHDIKLITSIELFNLVKKIIDEEINNKEAQKEFFNF
jgi:hypothetical protein